MAQALKKDRLNDALTRNSTNLVSAGSWNKIHKRARFHYEQSLDAKTRNEQTTYHRGQAKELANQLRRHQPSRSVALNLLARIGLDEGFYQLAEHYLKEALLLNDKDSGCWFSLGHVRLATKDYNNALVCFSKALEISPSQTRAATSLAYTLVKQGRTVEAFQAYRNLIRVHPDDQQVQAKLFEIVAHIQADFYQLDLEKDVTHWFNIDTANFQALAPLTISLLSHKYKLDNSNAVIDLQDIAQDTLLLLSLEKILFTNRNVENFLILARKQTFIHSIAGGYQDIKLLVFAGKLALHAEHNEHAWLYDKEEQDLLGTLKDLLKEALAQDNLVDDISHLFTLYAMYEPLSSLEGIGRLTQSTIANWPTHSHEIIQRSVIYNSEELLLAKKLKVLSPLSDSVSLEVQSQYEENPYPRWLHLGYNTPTNYGRALEQELEGFRAPDFFNMGAIKVLIAGAGTGQHALRVARYFRNVEVLALDLSTRSLAYAQRMAKQYDIKNVRFLCGDILELDRLDEKFHVIECSGVLHHMKNPELGLAKLKTKLVKRGLIKLGLYSYNARGIVRTMREVIQKYDLPPTADGIRTLRQAILEGNMPYNFNGILKSPDFYSLSGCRDLLFHVQEYQYEPQELKTLVANEQMNFLGFIVPDSVRAAYRAQYPDDPKLINLDNWQQYEKSQTDLFSGMFQFYIQ